VENISKINGKPIRLLVTLIFFLVFKFSFSLTLDEAIELAKENNPLIKQYDYLRKSRFYELQASKGNFLPFLSYTFNYSRYFEAQENYFNRTHSLGLQWNLYNQWNNIYLYRISKLNFEAENENYRKVELDIIYKVKLAYFNAVANYRIKEFRKKQVELAKIDWEVAKKKFKLGLVKKSDVLNSRVRYEQAKYNYIKSVTDYKTSLVELNSLIGLPLDKEEKLDIKILEKNIIKLPDFNVLKSVLYHYRPEIKLAKYQIDMAKEEIKKNKYSFTPSFSLFFKTVKDYSSLFGGNEYSYYGLNITWNIFSGLQRVNKYLASKEKELSQKQNYNEIKRQIELSLYKKYLQYIRTLENIKVAKVLLSQAELNYTQVFNEYKFGKNDIVALINAETSLINAKETLIKSLLEIATLKADIERELGIKDLRKLTDLSFE